MVPLHPDVERVMQKEIRQDRAYHPTLWRSSLPLDEAPILHLYGCLQPTFDVQKHPWAIRVFADRAHQQLGIDLIEEALDVEIQNPRITPASLPRHPDRIERRVGVPCQLSTSLLPTVAVTLPVLVAPAANDSRNIFALPFSPNIRPTPASAPG
jgi:hypothetical protein